MVRINRWSDDIDCPENNPVFDSSKEIWTMKNGKSIRVGDMSDQHVINTYHMVLGDEYWTEVFHREIVKRKIEEKIK